MKVYAVIDFSYDGIKYIKLFKSPADAKTHMRKLNRERGFDCYEVQEMTLNQ